MGATISSVMTILTVVALVGGALFGLMRGRNRSILRLALIIVCIIAAVLMRGTLVDLLMGIETENGTLKETLVAAFNQEGASIPVSLQNLICALIEMIVGLIGYFILFFTLRFITGVILFPILKIFVRKGKKKGVLLGGVIGLVQGVVIAFAVLAPLNGLLFTVYATDVVEMPSELKMDEYVESPIGKLYAGVGGWYFEEITKVELEDGKELDISDASDIVTTVTGVAGSVKDITESVEILGKGDATPQEKVETVKEVGQKLTELGEKIDNMDEDATEVINEIIEDVKELIKTESEGNSEDVDKVLENLDLEKLNIKSVGQGMTGIATYIEKTEMKTEETEEVTQEDIDNIVQGFAGSITILDLVADGGVENTPTIIEVPEEHKEMFNTALDNIEEGTLTPEQKEVLKKLVGMN